MMQLISAVGFLIWFLINVICAFYCYAVAENKGHQSMSWFFGGLCFGPIALVAAIGLGDLVAQRMLQRLDYLMTLQLSPDIQDRLRLEEEERKRIREKSALQQRRTVIILVVALIALLTVIAFWGSVKP